MSFEEALAAPPDEGFKATVYAMNTLLIHKGIYTQGNFRRSSWNGLRRSRAQGACGSEYGKF